MSALLGIEGLSVDFPYGHRTVHAVRDVSFSVDPGRIVGIVGESGSGKSVTCRAVLGLLPQRARVSGGIAYNGRDLTGMSMAELRKVRGREVSMIFQNPSSHLDPLMTVGDQIAEPLRYHFGLSAQDARKEALRLLEEVRIRDAGDRYGAYPHQLSGGMKQRVLIAAALACRPKMLLADEPTTALDVTVQANILALLKRLNRDRGLTMVLVSHDLGVVASICDSVVVMRAGRVVEKGSVSDVIARPQDSYTRTLIDSQPSRLKVLAGNEQRDAGLIQIENLKVYFAGSRSIASMFGRRRHTVKAVDDVSLEVRAGECFGIVGESGSGKSTVARAIVRLVNSTSGAIRYAGQQVDTLTGSELAAYRRKVQMVFQSPFDSLNPRMTVRQTIAEPIWRHGLGNHDAALARTQELMALVELSPELSDRKPRQLSGGQCQRVAIARALALSPRVLIADEVTSALDVTIQAQILALLARLRRTQNLTIIYISHDLAVVRAFCDRVAVFRDGMLVETGATEEVFNAPAQAYTKALIAAAPRVEVTPDRVAAS